ncbi:helix-turn-helix domain-containing protein [Mucilaginibacter sp. McL0603]|uniref:helix-turn-helix domain-containing protein n=1 Tax=Mucilaginibacter sp. McL0603 TaxID=3415670 RepID=UPI003CF9EDE0
MINIYNRKINNPKIYRQFKCGESLITLYNCPLKSRFQDVWSHHNYIVYVMAGRKVWHTSHGSYELNRDSCVFVRKGASILEQFFDGAFCLVVFFLPDEFICDVLRSKTIPLYRPEEKYQPVISLNSDEPVRAFFQTMVLLFESGREPDPSLIEIKFRELILTLAEDAHNSELLSFFGSLLHEPQAVSLQAVMDDNYCFNLKLEDLAVLSNRSLSTFKRDFKRHFQCTPGKWLMEKRLNHAMNLLTNTDKTVSEATFESGFESPSHFSRAFRDRFGVTPRSRKKAISQLNFKGNFLNL